MPSKPRILAVGSSNMDFITYSDRLPMPGETYISDGGYKIVPGGKGANAAVSAARLGADVIFCGKAGNDSYGSTLLSIYKKEGIDTRFFKLVKNAPTGLAAISVDKSGQNRITVFPGANKLLTKNDIDEAFDTCPDALLIQFEIDKDIILYAVDQANRAEIPVIIDAGPFSPGLNISSLGRIEIFSPNESEAFAYTSIRPTSPENYIKICLDLYSRLDVKYIVLKLGDKGCYIYDGHIGKAVPSYHVRAVDTTAAGDAFTAAMTHEYIRSDDIVSACKYANAVGALTVMKEGALPSLPTEKQVIEFIKAN